MKEKSNTPVAESGELDVTAALEALTKRYEAFEASMYARISGLERMLGERGESIPPRTLQARWHLVKHHGYRRVVGEPYTLIRPASPNDRIRERLYAYKYGLRFIDDPGEGGDDEQ